MNTGVIMLALVAVSGVSLFFNFDEIFTPDNKISKSGAMLVGNVEVVKRDGEGNIVAYRQGDNHIVLGGMEIIARQVFGNGPGSNNTNSSGFEAPFNYGGGVVQYMEIGNGTNDNSVGCIIDSGNDPVLGFDNYTLECPLGLISNGFDVDRCLRVQAVINRFNATEQPPGGTDAAQLNLTAVATFSGAAPNSCAAQNIGEAGIWNNPTGGPTYHGVNHTDTAVLDGNVMFARNTFGTVNLSSSDSLELTWKFTFTDN